MTPPNLVQPKGSLDRPVRDNLPPLSFTRLLGARLYLHTWVRLVVSIAIIIGAYVGKHLVGIDDLRVQALVGVAFAIAAYNAVAWFISRSYRTPERSAGSYHFLSNVMYATIVLDFLSLTVAVWLVGGARSPFLGFYLLHIILSCILLPVRLAWPSLSLAYALLGGLVICEWLRLIPLNKPVGAIVGPEEMDGRFALTVLLVYGTLFGLTFFLMIGVTGMIRRDEKVLRRTNAELDRLSNMRRDFLHIALHDLKAPVAAVSGLLGNLRSGLLGEMTDKQSEWVDRSLKRLGRLKEFLQDLQMLASLENTDLSQQAEQIDLEAMARDLVEESQDLAAERGHRLRLETPGERLPEVRGVPRLLRVALLNYLTNAIKYTPPDGEIQVRCLGREGILCVEVEDTGIGISAEDCKRLFNEFVRVRKGEAAKAEGTGLGLSIVRRVVEAHGGSVGVHSQPGKGSTFFFCLPASTS
ncbi:MAG: sensor histidine kinase [Phycisphaerales bacterium JB038]